MKIDTEKMEGQKLRIDSTMPLKRKGDDSINV